MPQRYTIETIYILGRSVDFREKKRFLDKVFIVSEKVMIGQISYRILENRHVHKQYIHVIKDMYNKVITSVKTMEDKLICFQL